ncbi:hypothetical protein N118_02245 [Mycobacterium tuberculosis MAL020187]|nr:hypothetical protein N118_02245 [Mycobacterium tuberculosis MAL020187]
MLLKGKVWTGLLGMFVVVLLVVGAVRLSRPHAPSRSEPLPAQVVANVVARGDGASLGCRITVNEVNRPGMSGDSSSWKGWGHVRWFIEEVPAGAA